VYGFKLVSDFVKGLKDRYLISCAIKLLLIKQKLI
jgi:hypothetical protein